MSNSFVERLFARGYSWLRCNRRRRNDVDPTAVSFASQQGRLQFLAAAIAGVPLAVRIQNPGQPGHNSRTAGLHVPPFAVHGESLAANEESYLLRVLLGAAAVRTETLLAPTRDCTELLARWTMLASELATRWPGFAPLWARWQPRLATWVEQGNVTALLDVVGCWPTLVEELAFVSEAPRATPTPNSVARKVAQMASTPELRSIAEQTQNPMLHNFEKLETVEEYSGGSRNVDGSDELADHAEALEEVSFNQVVRTSQVSESMLQGNVDVGLGKVEIAACVDLGPTSREFRYREWSVRGNHYLPDWCRLLEQAPPRDPEISSASPSTQVLAQARQLRVAWESLRNRYEWQRRHYDGPEVDIDAVVRYTGDLCRGTVGDDRLYLRRRRLERDLATLVLVDRSLSTDSWVAGRRVGDVISEALLILGHGLKGLDCAFEIAAFSSHTRSDCRYDILKEFHTDWQPLLDNMATWLKPEGYTRIGPALRHATARLARQPARRRLLLVVSDSRPTDYDAYEGLHGLADVSRAVEEARAQRIVVKGFAVAAEREARFSQLYGAGQFDLLHSHEKLGELLFRAHLEAMRSRG
jgi:nitric oxide reductase activation protein